MNKTEVDLLKYLIEVDEFIGHVSKGFGHYSTIYDFFLKEATMRRYAPLDLDKYHPGEVGNCFFNSMMGCSTTLRYCEGYALCSFMPVLHAWLLDEDDNVVDLTWNGHHFDDCEERAYFGVIFEERAVRTRMIATGFAGSMVDMMELDFPFMRKKFVHGDAEWQSSVLISDKKKV